jgi:hypothetical protein
MHARQHTVQVAKSLSEQKSFGIVSMSLAADGFTDVSEIAPVSLYAHSDANTNAHFYAVVVHRCI